MFQVWKTIINKNILIHNHHWQFSPGFDHFHKDFHYHCALPTSFKYPFFCSCFNETKTRTIVLIRSVSKKSCQNLSLTRIILFVWQKKLLELSNTISLLYLEFQPWWNSTLFSTEEFNAFSKRCKVINFFSQKSFKNLWESTSEECQK